MNSKTGIDLIGSSLAGLISEHGIIARCELLNRVYEYVRTAGLSREDRAELEKQVGKNIASGIFMNVLSGAPMFSDLPKLDTYTTLHGRLFHFVHTNKYSRQDFDQAYRRFVEGRPELRAVLEENLAEVLTGFMSEAGYRLAGRAEEKVGEKVKEKELLRSSPRLRFEAAGRAAEVLVLTSIKNLDPEAKELKPNPEVDLIILVPSGESVEPFMRFYRESGSGLEEAGVEVWIANLEKGTIDPYIGYVTDMDIYRQFKNPRLAENVRSTWELKKKD